MVTVLDPDQPSVHLAAFDAVVHGPVFATKRAPHSPLKGLDAAADGTAPDATWRVGLVHGAIAIPGKTDGDEVVITTEEIAASNLDYLALGHWHSAQTGKAGSVTWAYSGAPEAGRPRPGRGRQGPARRRSTIGRAKAVAVEERQVGKTRFEKTSSTPRRSTSQPALDRQLRPPGPTRTWSSTSA